jgi:hypothetical protein
VIYRLVLGRKDDPGLIHTLARANHSEHAARLASQILEIDYALRVEGERPFSPNLIDYLSWAWIWQWMIAPNPGADSPEREATNLWNPKTILFYEPVDLEAPYESRDDLVLHTRRKPLPAHPPEPIWFAPRSPLQTYRMLESFEAALDAPEQHFNTKTDSDVELQDAARDLP